mmetsp:Transcript_41156/g.117078  ORF Transcript_41156/g.117078 Transcript_41156/m.117078 type:complete len:95 (-) Transcript_41156:127-411(-)
MAESKKRRSAPETDGKTAGPSGQADQGIHTCKLLSSLTRTKLSVCLSDASLSSAVLMEKGVPNVNTTKNTRICIGKDDKQEAHPPPHSLMCAIT